MITFKNTDLIKFVQSTINKNVIEFHEDDLLNIEEISLNSKNFADEYNFVEFEDLQFFKGLKILNLKNLTITNKAIEILSELSKLEELNFLNCGFENVNGIMSLTIKKLTLNDCRIEDNSFIYTMNYLQELNIISSYLNISRLNKFYLLKSLNLSNSIVTNVDSMNLPVLEELILDYSNITNLNFVLNLHTLKILSLSRDQIDNNKDIVKLLMNNGVAVYEDNIIQLSKENLNATTNV